MNDEIIFYFDLISPYAYLAWNALPAIAARHERRIRPVPVLFAALLNHHGQLGPAEVEPKRRYVGRDILRRAATRGLRLAPPPAHPFNPLLALRVIHATEDLELRARLTTSLFDAVWAEGVGVEDPAEVGRRAAAVGFPRALEAAVQPANKAALRASTESAIAAGVFGVPTMLVDGELFWGDDSLSQMDAFLAGNDPLVGVASELARWEAIRPTAVRPAGTRGG